MRKRLAVSAVVITLNEEHNLKRCLKSLDFVSEILVVDSGSTDGTRRIAEACGARFLENPWTGYGQQKNWALDRCEQEWVLFLDADEEMSSALREEICALFESSSLGKLAKGYRVPRKTWYLGRWILHGGWYPNRLTRLAHKASARWTELEVHESLQVQGETRDLQADLLHYTFRDVGDQVTTNIRFSRLGAKVAAQRGEKGTLSKILFKPVGKFLETYLWKCGFLDGLPGFVISINAAHSIFMKYVELRFEKNISRR